MSSQDWKQQSQLNESRFLIEELNLEQEPTQEEILDRAQELEIDDLVLAKESLTKQLDPEWKPYCNRYSQIYYINLAEKLAYLDHPIDMQFKQLYAKSNGMPVPRFQNFKLQQISQSLELIENEIKNFQRSHKTTLRIVYQEPSQEQALSSHLKSPANNRKDFENQSQVQQLSLAQLENLHAYEKQLEQKYYQQYLKRKKEMRAKQIANEEDHQNTMKFITERKVEQICEAYEDELVRKNKLSLQRQEQKMQSEYQQKRMEYCENIEKFNKIFEKLREKQRNIQTVYQNKNASERAMAVGNIKLKADYQKLKAVSLVQEKLKQEFGQKIMSLYSSSPTFQQALLKPLQKLSASQPMRTYTRKMIEKPRRPLFENRNTEMRKIQTDIEYEQLKKEIKDLSLWESEDFQPSLKIGNRVNFNSSNLNLKLRMRVI